MILEVTPELAKIILYWAEVADSEGLYLDEDMDQDVAHQLTLDLHKNFPELRYINRYKENQND